MLGEQGIADEAKHDNYSQVINEQKAKKEITFDIDKEFPIKNEMDSMMRNYLDVLDGGVGMLKSDVINFKIETNADELPLREHAFRMAEDKRSVLKQQIEEHIKEGRVRPSTS